MDEITAFPDWIFELPDNEFRRDFEAKASVESLEELQQQRRDVIELLAPLELLFGSGGDRWTALRRQHRDGISKLILGEPGNSGLAANRLEVLANGDPRHEKFVRNTEAKYPKYMMLKTALTEIEERIESRLAEVRYAAAEARLAS
jgi:hypothetical protein